MRLLSVFLLFASLSALLVSAQERNTDDDTPVAPIVRTAEMNAQDLKLAKRIGNEFAEGIMKVRVSQDIHDFSDWLLESVTFQICENRLHKGELQWYITKAILDPKTFPGQLQIDAVDAYTRGDNLSFVADADGFIFEANDRIILDFKKQKDGSWKLSHGTILTCRKAT